MLKSINSIVRIFLAPDGVKFLILISILLISTIFELIGIVSIYPIIQHITNENIANDNIVMATISRFALQIDISAITLYFILCVIFVVVSMITKIYSTKYKFFYLAQKDREITSKMFQSFLDKNYSWYTTINSSEKTKLLLTDVTLVVTQGVLSTVNIISSLLLIAIFLSFLLLSQPFLTLFIILFFLLGYALFYFISKQKLKIYSEKRLHSNNQRFRIVNHLFSGISEIKINKLQKFMLQEFEAANDDFVDSFSKTQFISLLPRYLLEFLVIFGFLIYLGFTIVLKYDIEEQIPILTLFAFSALKILPAAQQIYYSIAQIRYIGPTLDVLLTNYSKFDFPHNMNTAIEFDLHKENTSLKFIKNITGEKIYFSLNGKQILENLTFTFNNKHLNYIVGPSGCGKSTLIKIILGFYNLDAGVLKLNDLHFSGIDRQELFARVGGYVPQDIYIFNESLLFNLFLLRESEIDELDSSNLAELLRVFGLEDFFSAHQASDALLSANGVSMSGGQRQRLGVLREVLKKPSVFIFDEAFTGIPLDMAWQILNFVRTSFPESLIIIVTHEHSLIQEGSNLVILNENT